jgi:hypothetical protein
MNGVDDDGVIFRRDTRAARRSERYDLNRAGTTASVELAAMTGKRARRARS